MFYFGFLLIVIPLLIAGFASYFINVAVRNRLVKDGNIHAKLISGIVSVASFLLILIAVFAVIISNMELSR